MLPLFDLDFESDFDFPFFLISFEVRSESLWPLWNRFLRTLIRAL